MSKILKSNIAIIDDDVLVRQSLGDCMESAGYAVESFEFGRGVSGLRIRAESCLPDSSMYSCQALHGLELQDKLAESDNRVPIVFVSAQGTQANREKAMSRGATGFLSKPFRREDLLKIVGAAIQH